MKLQGHRALITGAGQGIGRACAEVFAARGADLVLLDKNPQTLAETTAAVSGPVKVDPAALDITDLNQLQTIVERFCGEGDIDILVNNAGFDRPGTTAKIEPKGFESVLGINLTVPLFLIQRLLPQMCARGWGRIVNVSSIYGHIGEKGEIAYCTAKAGMIGLTKSVAKECAQNGVTVNTVLPGITRTPTIMNFMAPQYRDRVIAQTPMGRMAEPAEIATAIAFLASEDATYITGTALPVSGGWGI